MSGLQWRHGACNGASDGYFYSSLICVDLEIHIIAKRLLLQSSIVGSSSSGWFSHVWPLDNDTVLSISSSLNDHKIYNLYIRILYAYNIFIYIYNKWKASNKTVRPNKQEQAKTNIPVRDPLLLVACDIWGSLLPKQRLHSPSLTSWNWCQWCTQMDLIWQFWCHR